MRSVEWRVIKQSGWGGFIGDGWIILLALFFSGRAGGGKGKGEGAYVLTSCHWYVFGPGRGVANGIRMENA